MAFTTWVAWTASERSRPRREHSSPDAYQAAALRAWSPRRRRAPPRLPRLSGRGRNRQGRQPAVALHRGVRGPRALGRGHRPDDQDIDRRVRALSRAGVTLRLVMDSGARSLRSLGRNDSAAARQATDSAASIPRDHEGPVFRHPCEAAAFPIALALHERGLFTWPEWAATLADEIKRAQP